MVFLYHHFHAGIFCTNKTLVKIRLNYHGVVIDNQPYTHSILFKYLSLIPEFYTTSLNDNFNYYHVINYLVNHFDFTHQVVLPLLVHVYDNFDYYPYKIYHTSVYVVTHFVIVYNNNDEYIFLIFHNQKRITCP